MMVIIKDLIIIKYKNQLLKNCQLYNDIEDYLFLIK